MKNLLPFVIFFFLLLSACSENPPKPVEQVTTSLAVSYQPYFIHLSDIHLSLPFDTTIYGGDTGPDLWKITCSKLDSMLGDKVNPPKFVLCTGDLPAHSNPDSGECGPASGNSGDHVDNIGAVMDSLHALFARHPNVPFFYVVGNNDGLDGDYYSFTDSKAGSLLTKFPADHFPALNMSTTAGTAPCVLDSSQYSMGYYAAQPVKGLRLLALNTVILGKKYNVANGISQSAAGDAEISWLTAQLQAAASAGDKVYLSMHIPPGIDAHNGKPMWSTKNNDQWLDQFLPLLKTYQNTISGILYGHTHMDELRLLYDSSDLKTPVEIGISAPAISPYHCNNPGFKMVYFQTSDFELTDFTTCYSTPGAAYFGNNTYKFSDVFGCSGGTIYNCLKNMNIDTINRRMDQIYYVKSPNGNANPLKTRSAIAVVPQ